MSKTYAGGSLAAHRSLRRTKLLLRQRGVGSLEVIERVDRRWGRGRTAARPLARGQRLSSTFFRTRCWVRKLWEIFLNLHLTKPLPSGTVDDNHLVKGKMVWLALCLLATAALSSGSHAAERSKGSETKRCTEDSDTGKGWIPKRTPWSGLKSHDAFASLPLHSH